MPWIVLKSFWRNRRSYRFFLLALLLSALVASLGLSGVKVMTEIWRAPALASYGGQIAIQVAGREDTQNSQFDLFSRTAVEQVIAEIFPEATVTACLRVPVRPLTKDFIFEYVVAVFGREGGLDAWYLKPVTRNGQPIHEDGGGEQLFFIRDTDSGDGRDYSDDRLLVPRYDPAGTWSFAAGAEISPVVAGTLRWPADYAITHLATLQALTGTPGQLVTSLGVAFPGVQVQVDPERLARLRSTLEQRFPELMAITVDEWASQMSVDLLPLRDSARQFLPLVLGIAMLVVVATALAVVQSRRRELSLLRVIGLSSRQVWLLFVLEAAIAGIIACAGGILIAKLIGYLIFAARLGGSLIDMLRTPVSLLPFALSLAVAVTVTALISATAVARSLTRSLRNG